MDIPQLNEALDVLEDAIVEFPVGTTTLDDLKPTEEKIEDLRRSLKPINARILTLKAVIDTGKIGKMYLKRHRCQLRFLY